MVASKPLSHEIGESLRGEILGQRYRAGERLPSERDLAARYHASRGAVREALSQLEQLGLIRVQPGGARVQPISAASIGILGPLMALREYPEPSLVDQFLQTFGALACLTARTAVSSGDEEQVNRLRQLLVSLGSNSEATNALNPAWRELLEALSDIADNLVVRLIGNDLRQQFVEQVSKLEIRAQITQTTVNRIVVELKKSLNGRDGDLAAAAVLRYFDALRAAVERSLLPSQQAPRQAAL